MIDLVSEAKLVQDYFEENHWSFCFIGGLRIRARHRAQDLFGGGPRGAESVREPGPGLD